MNNEQNKSISYYHRLNEPLPSVDLTNPYNEPFNWEPYTVTSTDSVFTLTPSTIIPTKEEIENLDYYKLLKELEGLSLDIGCSVTSNLIIITLSYNKCEQEVYTSHNKFTLDNVNSLLRKIVKQFMEDGYGRESI